MGRQRQAIARVDNSRRRSLVQKENSVVVRDSSRAEEKRRPGPLVVS